MKKILIIAILVLAALLAAVFIYRYEIIKYSAETLLHNCLPSYVRIDEINFDFTGRMISVKGFKIMNAPGFSNNVLLGISEISASYKMRGKGLLDGFEIYDVVLKKPVLSIERAKSGTLNLNEMQSVIEGEERKKPASPVPGAPKDKGYVVGDKKVYDLVKLPEAFRIEGGRLVFIDNVVSDQPYLTTIDNIDSTMGVKLDNVYSKLLNFSSRGSGNFNDNSGAVIKWTTSWDPSAPRLTMSNRFDVSDIYLPSLEPYYNRYSPFVFQRGYFSGILIFDFDNGRIGSTNEVRLRDLRFYVKKGFESAPFWETNVENLLKYFTSSTGELVFDFKIKGDMSQPQFYLGPISKQALAAMAVDKISAAIEAATKGAQGKPSSGGNMSDIDKAKEYIDLFRNIIKK